MTSTSNPISKKSKLSSKIEERLLSTKKYIQSWWIIFGMTLLFFGITIAVLVVQFTQHSATIMANMEVNKSYGLASQILVYISYGIFVAPYLYVAGAWMSGVNNISRSKNLHLTLWIIYSICITIALIAMILNIKSLIL